MKNYSKIIFYFFGVLLMSSLLVSCNKDEEVLLSNLNVQVEYSTDFTGLLTNNLTVTITNTVDNSTVDAITDANGLAEFIDLAPGTYSVASFVSLTAEEAQEASGYYEEMTLNAVENNVELIGGIDSDITLTLDGQPSAGLVIKEFYYNGANDPTWGVLNKDQFVEIYNNSDEVIYADGLYVASLAPMANGEDDTKAVSTLDYETFIYANKITQVPGNGTENPIQPGESIVIAFGAVDWTDGGAKADITVDLSGADFELYAIDWLESLGRTGNAYFDIDNVDVPNMNGVYLNIENYGTFQWYAQGASCAIFSNDSYTVETILDPESSLTSPQYYAKIAVADVIDAIDVVFDENSAAYKDLPASLDAGFTYVDGGSYTSQSVRRLVSKTADDGRKVLKDTNNSSNDFEVIALATPKAFGK